MDAEVAKFEEMILFFADAHTLHGPNSGRDSGAISPFPADLSSGEATDVASTPELTPARSSSTSSLVLAVSPSPRVGSASFSRRLHHMLDIAAFLRNFREKKQEPGSDVGLDGLFGKEMAENAVPIVPLEQVRRDALEAWELEAAKVDRSVRILPGVRKLMDSIPAGRYAVATSGAKTYGKP